MAKSTHESNYFTITRPLMNCPICGKEFIKSANSFRAHMRKHIRSGEITTKQELRMRINVFGDFSEVDNRKGD